MRIPATKIVITRAEGPSHLCGKPHTFEGELCWSSAEAFLFTSASSAPRAGGYDKHDVTIEFGQAGENGHLTFQTRFDLSYEGSGRLGAQVRREWEYNAGRWHPARMTDEQHRAALAYCKINTELWALRCDVYDLPQR